VFPRLCAILGVQPQTPAPHVRNDFAPSGRPSGPFSSRSSLRTLRPAFTRPGRVTLRKSSLLPQKQKRHSQKPCRPSTSKFLSQSTSCIFQNPRRSIPPPIPQLLIRIPLRQRCDTFELFSPARHEDRQSMRSASATHCGRDRIALFSIAFLSTRSAKTFVRRSFTHDLAALPHIQPQKHILQQVVRHGRRRLHLSQFPAQWRSPRSPTQIGRIACPCTPSAPQSASRVTGSIIRSAYFSFHFHRALLIPADLTQSLLLFHSSLRPLRPLCSLCVELFSFFLLYLLAANRLPTKLFGPRWSPEPARSVPEFLPR